VSIPSTFPKHLFIKGFCTVFLYLEMRLQFLTVRKTHPEKLISDTNKILPLPSFGV